MTSVEVGVSRHILVHVGGRYFPRRRHTSVETGWNGLGFLRRGARYVGQWSPISNVHRVASKEDRQLIVPLTFLQCGDRCVGKWVPIPNVYSVALEE